MRALSAVPFNRPVPVGEELRYLAEAVASAQLSDGGPFAGRCIRLLEELLPGSRVLLTTSCTTALEMTATLLEVGPGDEVIVPSFAFVSTANAYALRGARPVFADVRPDSLNIDETHVERLVSPRTKVIVPVHYAGVGCEMEALLGIAARHGLRIVEDNAHGLFGSRRDRPLGTSGTFATLSFHQTKNVTCGEGGALVVNDPAYFERALTCAHKGTDRARMLRGLVDRYTWVSLGSSTQPSELLAAFLCAQLERHREVQAARRRMWERYERELRPWAERGGVRLPVVPPDCAQSYHLFYLIADSVERRDHLIAHLLEHGVEAVFHYQPLHLSHMGRKLGGKPGDCPVTAHLSQCLLRLPLSNGLTEDEQTRVIEALLAVR